MKRTSIKTKLLTAMLTLCMALTPLPAFAAEPSAETADFTTGGGTAAIELLNTFRTDGAAASTWDDGSKTLTLRGVDFTTTAATAVKLPAGSTIVLADGSANAIQSGDVTLEKNGDYKSQTFINALDAAGSLTIQGGTGTLDVAAGSVRNTGDGWVYSSGIRVDGDFTVKGGQVTVRGGSVESDGTCFSMGVNMDSDTKNKALLVTGGTLTAIAGEAYEREEDGGKRPVFSRGVYLYRGSVTVSGVGRLLARSVKEMADGGVLSNGLYISVGDLSVSGQGRVEAEGAYGAYISGGGIRLDGGSLTAISTQTPDAFGNPGNAVDVEISSGTVTANAGNITVSGGTLETENGSIYMATYGAAENQGLFTVTGGSVVNQGRLNGAQKISISGGSVETQQTSAKELVLSGGSLTVREPVRRNPYSGGLYGLPAVDVRNLTVSGGALDAAWDWGEYTPVVLPKDEEYNDVGLLVRMPYDTGTASFTGGITILDTGFAGNTALELAGQLVLGEGMAETGADEHHRQLGAAPVRFAAASAETLIREVIIGNVKFDYAPGEAPEKSAAPSFPDNAESYEIAYECWEEMENGSPAAFWYSDESRYSTSMERITRFEDGKRYVYSLELKAKDGYAFADDCTVTVNGSAVAAANLRKTQDGLLIMAVKTIAPTSQQEPEYRIIEGANGVWTPGDGALRFVANGDFSRFTGVQVDGVLLAEDQYTAASGSTVITLNRDYLAALAVGRHTLTVVYSDGQCGTDFQVLAAVSHTHRYGSAWKYDEASHWRQCACGDQSDAAAHTFRWVVDKEATAAENGSRHEECSVCGYQKVAVEIPAAGSVTEPTGQPGQSDDTDIVAPPKTGSAGRMSLWIALLSVSCGAAAMGRKKKRK